MSGRIENRLLRLVEIRPPRPASRRSDDDPDRRRGRRLDCEWSGERGDAGAEPRSRRRGDAKLRPRTAWWVWTMLLVGIAAFAVVSGSLSRAEAVGVPGARRSRSSRALGGR